MYVERWKLAKNESKLCSNCRGDLAGDNFNYRISFVFKDYFNICERCAKSLQRSLEVQFDLAKEPKWYKSEYRKFFKK